MMNDMNRELRMETRRQLKLKQCEVKINRILVKNKKSEVNNFSECWFGWKLEI